MGVWDGFSEATVMGIRCAADILRGSRRTVVLTGAGISTPSGVPDFRSKDSGLWERFDPLEVASLNAFRYDPLRFYNWLRGLAREIYRATPNPAHYALARLEEAGYVHTVITQNIDALHQRAGSRRVLEVHGTINTLTCTRCYRTFPTEDYLEAYLERGEAPYCTQCGGILKPDLILMGEQLPARVWLEAQRASRECEVMLVAGSSLEVLPVAGLPMRALESGAHLIVINYSPTYVDVRADVVLYDDVATIIPRLAAEVLGE